MVGGEEVSKVCSSEALLTRATGLPASEHIYFLTFTAQQSVYVPHSGHYMYRTVVTIRTAQWSLYVPHSGHYTYRTVVTIRTAQWSLYVP